jgi:hypothetical protein
MSVHVRCKSVSVALRVGVLYFSAFLVAREGMVEDAGSRATLLLELLLGTLLRIPVVRECRSSLKKRVGSNIRPSHRTFTGHRLLFPENRRIHTHRIISACPPDSHTNPTVTCE